MTTTLAVLAVLLAPLCLPFWVELSLEEGWRFQTRVHWPARSAPAFAPGAATNKPGPKPRRGRKAGSRPAPRKIRALLRSPDFLSSLVRLARRLVVHLRPRQLRLRLRFGLGDPADTGRACGALAPLFLVLSRLDVDELRFQPDFAHRAFDLQGRAIIRVVPGVLLALIAGYFLTRAPWRALASFARA
ncbi:MAG TPA: DUF2953 domain-containing protein [Polyangiaceae bacterium]